jgi:hypothetical protein
MCSAEIHKYPNPKYFQKTLDNVLNSNILHKLHDDWFPYPPISNRLIFRRVLNDSVSLQKVINNDLEF